MHDVYVYGMLSPSAVHLLDDRFSFPRPNEYAEIARTYPSIGGEAINSAIVLSRFGVKTKLDGIWINKKAEPGIRQLLAPFDIDLSRLTVKEGEYGTMEVVISDRHSRTVFGNYASFHDGERQWNTPVEEDIRAAALVVLDPYHKQESRMVAEWCVRHGKPFVTHDVRHDDYIAEHAAAAIISHELRDQAYREAELETLFQTYLDRCRGLTVFTFGSDALWYARPNQSKRAFHPYKITPLDTAGAGDAFRGAVAYGLLKHWNDEAVIDFASATAACVCLTIPHALNAPDLEGVRRFMDDHKRDSRV
jgi:sugar/nucleoside kinase (ribokinase family)